MMDSLANKILWGHSAVDPSSVLIIKVNKHYSLYMWRKIQKVPEIIFYVPFFLLQWIGVHHQRISLPIQKKAGVCTDVSLFFANLPKLAKAPSPLIQTQQNTFSSQP